jgi:hypothetical protein
MKEGLVRLEGIAAVLGGFQILGLGETGRCNEQKPRQKHGQRAGKGREAGRVFRSGHGKNRICRAKRREGGHPFPSSTYQMMQILIALMVYGQGLMKVSEKRLFIRVILTLLKFCAMNYILYIIHLLD